MNEWDVHAKRRLMARKLFDRTVFGDAELAFEFIGNILESSASIQEPRGI